MRCVTLYPSLLALIVFTASCSEQIVEPDIQARVETEQTLALGKKSGTSWRVPGDFATIQDAIDDADVLDGDWILVGSGNHAGALVDKRVNIKGEGRAVINTGPLHPAGLTMGLALLSGSDGASISHLTFSTDFPIMNRAAVNGVTITHNTLLNSIQGISNWRGSGWTISQNEIVDLRTRCGGGIGILVGDHAGGTVADNLVSHNKLSGTVHVSDADCGGYDGSGIVLFADFRWGRLGAAELRNNRVVNNKVSMVSDTPTVVGVVAFELTDTREDANEACDAIFDNAVGFNDWRGTETQLAFSPEELEACNAISRNLGDNRGHGLHPSAFGPGGN